MIKVGLILFLFRVGPAILKKPYAEMSWILRTLIATDCCCVLIKTEGDPTLWNQEIADQ